MLENIEQVISENTNGVQSAFDIFSGSGVVAAHFKQMRLKTICNDFLYFSYVLQQCRIGLNRKPAFKELGMKNPIAYLNSLSNNNITFPLDKCFIYNNYSPVGGRMYFREENALKIDLIRLTIQEWYEIKKINDNEYFYLLSSLIDAVPFVANITGVYAAYLKFWDARALLPLKLKEPEIYDNKQKNKCYNLDYSELLNVEADLLYADPPYNSREYLPNYHVLETIAKYDYPEIKGVTGMRGYERQKSDFCKKKGAVKAFERLIRDTKCRYVLISYNNEGIVPTDELSAICQKYAVGDTFKLFEYNYRRYKSKIPNNHSGLREQLYFFRRH